jgi:hypothetical protein
LELHEKKEDSKGQKGQSRKQNVEKEKSERIEKLGAEEYRDAGEDAVENSRLMLTYLSYSVKSLLSINLQKEHGGSNRICVRERKQRVEFAVGRSKLLIAILEG